MNWEKFWDNVAKTSTNEIEQVQRKDFNSIILTTQNIHSKLQIDENDTVLDVCCGNGLITNEIAKKCKSIIGVDLSNILIENAKQNYPNIKFIKANATELSQKINPHTFDKIYLQFSFQYLDKKKEGEKVISEMLKILKPNGKIFIGDIPDKEKLWTYYNSLEKRFFYIISVIKKKKKLGKFWNKKELDSICHKKRVKGKVLEQPQNLPYANYRFDYLIEK